jgi:antitoxin HicB
MNLCYPADVRRYRSGTVGLFFADVPEAATVGKTLTEAIDHAPDALIVALSAYVDDGRAIPTPSRARRGQPVVCLPPLAALKLAIHDAMTQQRVTQAALAERLGVDGRQVRRILNLDHESKFSQIEAALGALGLRASVSVEKNVSPIPA